MAKKYVCDRCGEEINPIQTVKRVNVDGYYHGVGDNYDLCVSCAFWLDKFLNDEILIERKNNG
jgi:hypothetical protein